MNASPPLLATDAIVSTPTIVQIRKNRMSKRPKCRWSLALSVAAAAVVVVSRIAIRRYSVAKVNSCHSLPEKHFFTVT